MHGENLFCREWIFPKHFSNEKRVKQNFPTVKKTLILVEKKSKNQEKYVGFHMPQFEIPQLSTRYLRSSKRLRSNPQSLYRI